LLPAIIDISRRTKIPLSRLLIPLSFSSLMGGNMTLIGTPPNVLAASILAERGGPTFAFFDFTPMGILVFAAGIIYMVFFGRHLLPIREPTDGEAKLEQVRQYISEVGLRSNSPLIGQTLAGSRLGADHDLMVVAIIRADNPQTTPRNDTVLQRADTLLVAGKAENLMQAQDRLGLTIITEQARRTRPAPENQVHIIEAVLAPRSTLLGQTLQEARLRGRYGFNVVAICRQGEMITRRLRDVRLRFGDILLLQGDPARFSTLLEGGDFLLLEPVQWERRQYDKAPLAIGIMALVLILVTLAGFHVSTAMVMGAVLMVLSRCLTMDQAYQSIAWRSIFLIAGMLPLGVAMETTGTAHFLADGIITLVGGWGPIAVLAGIYVLAGLITEPMSNAAATVLIVPIAIDTALAMGANPQTFVLATVIGASTSFLTPVGHQANVLVFGPGGYRFFDYTRVGGLLNLVLLLVSLIFLPVLWPL